MSHIGLVLGSDENYMYTVEGNVDGMIKFVRRSYKNDSALTFVMNNSGDYMIMDLSGLDFVDKVSSVD